MSEIVQLHTVEQVILQTNSDESITLTGNAINVIVATPFDPTLSERIDEIYLAGQTAITNGSYSGGVLRWTGGTITTPLGDVNGVMMTVPASTSITLSDTSCAVAGQQNLSVIWSTQSDPIAALSALLQTQQGLYITYAQNDKHVAVDGITGYGFASAINQTFTASGQHLVFEISGMPNATFQTAETSLAQPEYLHIFVIDPDNGMVPDATIGFDGPITTATGLLPDEIAARISGDVALASGLTAVQTIAETNQLNINERALQTDFDSLAEIVTDNGLLLASRASQSDLDNLATEVSTKATPADISAAIAALVDGAPASLDTLAEISAALAGDEAAISDLLTQINNRVRFDAAQSLTTAQQLQARQNISAEAVGVAAALVAAITAASIGAATAAQGAKADSALQSGDVAPVALSGSYTALKDKPTLFGLSSLLTGLGAGSNTAITAADSLINALANLQKQVSTNASSAATNAATNAGNIAVNSALITPVRKKIGGAWYVTGRLYDCVFPYAQSLTTAANGAGTQLFFPMQILENGSFDQITVNVSAAGAGSSLLLGIYDSDAQNLPNNLLIKSSALDSTTTGQKTFGITQSFTAGQVVWLSLLNLTASVSYTAIAGSALLAFRGHATITQLPVGVFYKSSQSDMSSTAGTVLESQNANFARIMLRGA